MGCKIATGISGAYLGDLLAQASSTRAPPVQAAATSTAATNDEAPAPAPAAPSGVAYDPLRAGRFMVYSGTVGTPVAHVW